MTASFIPAPGFGWVARFGKTAGGTKVHRYASIVGFDVEGGPPLVIKPTGWDSELTFESAFYDVMKIPAETPTT